MTAGVTANFTDPAHPGAAVALVARPDLVAPLSLRVHHPNATTGTGEACPELAPVSAELDAFYCPACGYNGRISGAWAVDVLKAAKETPE